MKIIIISLVILTGCASQAERPDSQPKTFNGRGIQWQLEQTDLMEWCATASQILPQGSEAADRKFQQKCLIELGVAI